MSVLVGFPFYLRAGGAPCSARWLQHSWRTRAWVDQKSDDHQQGGFYSHIVVTQESTAAAKVRTNRKVIPTSEACGQESVDPANVEPPDQSKR